MTQLRVRKPAPRSFQVPLADEVFRVPAHGFLSTVHTSSLPWARATEMVREANAERTRRRALSTPSPVSAMEIALLAGLLYYKLEPICQAPIGPFDADFLFPGEHLVVEVDGREWHDKKRDEKRDDIMGRDGYLVLRFKAREVFCDPLRCARDVQAELA